MSRGLFGRIARHPLRAGRDEREDRLTEVVAAVLGHPACADLGQFLVAGWLDVTLPPDDWAASHSVGEIREAFRRDDWVCEIRTQISVTVEQQQRRPDLELRFTRPESQPVLVYVEVKHGTDPHTHQLEAYVADQANRSAALALVFLVAPRASYPFAPDQIPMSVPQLTWEATSALLRLYRPSSPVSRLLVDELLIYLREEGLVDPERVTPEHLVAVAYHAEAVAALERVYELADLAVAGGWAAPPPGHSGRYGTETWWTYPPRPPDVPHLGRWELAWHVFRESTQLFPDGRRGVPRIAAGAAADWGTLHTISSSTKDRLASEGFQLFEKGDLRGNTRERIWRLAYPEEVLAGASLDAQGRALGQWVAKAFSDVQTTLISG